MTETRKPQHKLPTVQSRAKADLPVDITVKDTFLAHIAEANDSRNGGGINMTIILYEDDGTKTKHQNGNEEVRLQWQYMPLSGPKFTAYTKAIFPEADAFLNEAGFDNEDIVDRWVLVTLEVEKKKEDDNSNFGPRLRVKNMNPIPEVDRERVRQICLRVCGIEPKRLQPPTAAGQAAAPQTAPAKPASAPAPQQSKPPVSTVPAGVDPNNPFGV